jgi:hypothetical protein
MRSWVFALCVSLLLSCGKPAPTGSAQRGNADPPGGTETPDGPETPPTPILGSGRLFTPEGYVDCELNYGGDPLKVRCYAGMPVETGASLGFHARFQAAVVLDEATGFDPIITSHAWQHLVITVGASMYSDVGMQESADGLSCVYTLPAGLPPASTIDITATLLIDYQGNQGVPIQQPIQKHWTFQTNQVTVVD